MTQKQFEKFLNELEEAFYWEVDDMSQCSYVQFREGFPVSRTYENTLVINGILFISFDVDQNEIQLFDTSTDVTGEWFYSWDMKDYSKVEVSIKIYKALVKKIGEQQIFG